MKKNNLIMIVVTISMFVVLLLGATYAYFASNTNTGNGLDMTITTDNNNIAFAATEGTLSMHVKAEDMLQSQTGSGDVLAAETVGEDNIVITLSTNTEAPIACTYNVYFQWNSNQTYTKTTGATKELTLELNLNDEDTNGSEGTNSFAGETQITDVVTGTTKTKIVNGAFIVGNSSNSGTQEWIPIVRFYNLAKDQSALAGKTIGGKFTIEDVECNAMENLSNKLTDEAESSTTASGVKEYTSSQDGTPYVIKHETAVGVATNATYTKVNNFGTTKVYSATSAYVVSGTDATGKLTMAADGTWTNNGTVTDTYYHAVLPIAEEGYYEICYTLGVGHTNNELQAFITDSANSTSGTNVYLGGSSNLSATANNAKSGCTYVGYLTSEKAVKIVNYAYTSIASVSFYLQKTNDESDPIDAGIRYEGNDPDNYVIFNGEEWRIIGIFEGSTIGLESGKQYTKIIKSESIGNNAWDEYQEDEEGNFLHENDWTNSTLNTYLNGEYLQGLTDKTKIAKYNGNYSTWHLRGMTVDQGAISTTNDWYLAERVTGGAGYRNGVLGDADERIQSAIAIMYPSDYGYAAYGEGCTRETTKLTRYDLGCAGVDWLLLEDDDEWLLSPNLGVYSNAVYVYGGNGDVNDDEVRDELAARPVLYLEASVQIAGGNGSKANPYKLS